MIQQFRVKEERLPEAAAETGSQYCDGRDEPVSRGAQETGLLSVLMPVYNEEEFVGECLTRVLEAPLPVGIRREIVVVDDCSTDESAKIVADLAHGNKDVIRLIRHEHNQGKGAAIRTAIRHAYGEYCLIQDADLEYNPAEYSKLVNPLIERRADVVYGSRFVTGGERRVLYYWHSVGNRFLTTLCNMASDLNLTDMETCYKAFRTSLLKSIPLRSNRFGIEPEITIKLAQRGVTIYETPISYHGRTYEEGKKIGAKDGLQALVTIVRYAFVRDIYAESGGQILDVLAAAPRFNRWMADTIRPFLGARVLEIGAGIGNLSVQLCPKRRRYVASDIDGEHLARLSLRLKHRRNVDVRHCDLQRSDDFTGLADGFDTVICLNVLEHVPDDLLALRNVRSALAPGGRAIILVPEGASLYGTLDEALGHFKRYSEASLRSRLEEAGFRLERLLEFNRMSRPGWYISGRILKKTRLSRFQIWAFDHLVWLWRLVDRLMPWRPISLIAIASRMD